MHRLSVGHVPVDGFWSLTVYDANGHFGSDSYPERAVNSRTAGRDAEHRLVIQFGGSAGSGGHHLQIARGWCYLVRMYRPRAEILGGKWKFPEVEIAPPTAGLS